MYTPHRVFFKPPPCFFQTPTVFFPNPHRVFFKPRSCFFLSYPPPAGVFPHRHCQFPPPADFQFPHRLIVNSPTGWFSPTGLSFPPPTYFHFPHRPKVKVWIASFPGIKYYFFNFLSSFWERTRVRGTYEVHVMLCDSLIKVPAILWYINQSS